MSISPSVPVSDLGHDRPEMHSPPKHYSWYRFREDEDYRRSRRRVWASVAILTVAMVWVGAYGMTRFSEQADTLHRMDGWKIDLSAAQGRVGQVEKRLAALPNDIQGVRDGLSGLDKKISSGLDQARGNVRDLGVSLRREIRDVRDTVSTQGQATDARFREVEAARQAEAARTAQLEREVAQLNQRLSAARQDVNTLQNSSAAESQQLRQDIRNAGTRLDNRISHVASFSNRPRGRFEAGVGRTVEIAPKVLLHITKVDPRYRRWSGHIQLVDEGKFVWLRDQSASQTVPFYAGKSALRYDLITTGLTEGGIAGYLVLPSEGELAGREVMSRN